MSQTVRPEDWRSLLRFREEYPEAKAALVYPGKCRWHERGVDIVPFADCVAKLDEWL